LRFTLRYFEKFGGKSNLNIASIRKNGSAFTFSKLKYSSKKSNFDKKIFSLNQRYDLFEFIIDIKFDAWINSHAIIKKVIVFCDEKYPINRL